MKIIQRSLVVALSIVFATTAFAQDENNPWVVTIATNAVDSYPTNQPNVDIVGQTFIGEQGKLFQNFYSTDNWNILPTITSLGVSRNIAERFSITGRFSFNQINKFGSSAAPGLVYQSVDLLMRKSYADKSATFEPFTEVGGGYVFLGDDQSFLFNQSSDHLCRP